MEGKDVVDALVLWRKLQKMSMSRLKTIYSEKDPQIPIS